MRRLSAGIPAVGGGAAAGHVEGAAGRAGP